MRDPNRIYTFTNKLIENWSKVPDWRFGQLMSNVIGAFWDKTHKDIFFVEDEEFFQFLEDYFSKIN